MPRLPQFDALATLERSLGHNIGEMEKSINSAWARGAIQPGTEAWRRVYKTHDEAQEIYNYIGRFLLAQGYTSSEINSGLEGFYTEAAKLLGPAVVGLVVGGYLHWRFAPDIKKAAAMQTQANAALEATYNYKLYLDALPAGAVPAPPDMPSPGAPVADSETSWLLWAALLGGGYWIYRKYA